MEISKPRVVFKKVGLYLGRTQVRNAWRSFAVDWLGTSTACPPAAMLITQLGTMSTYCCLPVQKENLLPHGFSQLTFSVSSFRMGQPAWFFHFYQREKVLLLFMAIWKCRLGCVESRTSLWLCGVSVLGHVSVQCRTLISRQGWGVAD